MVVVGTGTSGTRFINKNYPSTEGLELGTTKLPEKPNLEAEKRLTTERSRVGL